MLTLDHRLLLAGHCLLIIAMSELDFIEWIKKQSKHKKPVLVGIGDDSAVIDVRNTNSFVITTDTLLDGTHFEQEKCTPKQIGRKAIASGISDIAAMGCKPAYALISISFSANSNKKYCKQIYGGILDITKKYDVQIIGGDIVSGDCPLNINVTTIGTTEGLKPVLRSGAKPGDVIMVTGKLGGSILGKHLRVEPRVAEGMKLNKDFKVNAMIDISDGLLIDLHHILEESSVGAVIDEHCVPISNDAIKLSKITKKAPISHAMTDGEDYELLFTVSETNAVKILRSNAFSIPLTEIGRVQKKKVIFIRDTNGRERFVASDGYEHLK